VPLQFKEDKRLLAKDKSNYYHYPIRILMVNDTFDSVELFSNGKNGFTYFSRLITDYQESLIVDHATPHYDFVVSENEEKQSFTFSNDLEDSLTFLLKLACISKQTYDEISYQMKLYNKSPSILI
jgi:hypothetical protein